MSTSCLNSEIKLINQNTVLCLKSENKNLSLNLMLSPYIFYVIQICPEISVKSEFRKIIYKPILRINNPLWHVCKNRIEWIANYKHFLAFFPIRLHTSWSCYKISELDNWSECPIVIITISFLCLTNGWYLNARRMRFPSIAFISRVQNVSAIWVQTIVATGCVQFTSLTISFVREQWFELSRCHVMQQQSNCRAIRMPTRWVVVVILPILQVKFCCLRAHRNSRLWNCLTHILFSLFSTVIYLHMSYMMAQALISTLLFSIVL